MRKVLASLLIFLILITSIPLITSAEDENTISIKTVSDWLAFAENCTLDSWSAGKEVVLKADLDFKGIGFKPAPLFAGHFNGNGHTIRHLQITEDASTYGLFRHILSGGVVEDLTVNGSYTPGGSAEKIGGIAGENSGTIRGCSFTGTIEAIRSAGGICGVNLADALVEDCSVDAFISAQHRSGGICGENAGTVTGCENKGAVNTEAIEEVEPESPLLMLSAEELIDITDIGGIAGLSSGVLRYCRNSGDVGYPRIGYNIGGIAGRQSGFTTACVNKGTVRGRKDVGGITGQLDPDTNWDFSESNIVKLQGMLGGLQDSINALIADAQWTGDAVSQNVQGLLGSLSGLGNAASSFINDLDNWLKVNVDSSLSIFGEGAFFDAETQQWLINLNPDLGIEAQYDEASGTFYVSKEALDAVFSLSANAGLLTDAPSALFSSLQNIESSLSALSGIIGDSPLLDDIRNVSNQTFAVSDFIAGMFNRTGSISSYDHIHDISENIQNRSVGVISDCSNTAGVKADTNTGGIIGAISIDFSFDREDELNLSAMLSGGAKYLIFAAAQNCTNASEITSDKTSAGGIAGRMDYGALIDCEASGTVRSEGKYAGGIAGYTKGALQSCRARAEISAQSYEGGIAGYGLDLIDCFSMPSLSDEGEYRGSIAGCAEGVISGNFYAGSSTGGIDGFSFEGAAKEVSYDELLSLCPRNTIFNSITLSFVDEDGNTQEVIVPFGGEIKNTPSIPDKDGMKWKWDDFDHSAVYHSMTIEGHYVSKTGTLSTGEDVPLFLVEGEFYEGQDLTVTPYSENTGLSARGRQTLSAYTANVENYNGSLLIRMREEDKGKLFVKDGKNFTEADYIRDGSYIVFPLKSGGSFAFISHPDNTVLWIICSILPVLIIIDTLALIFLRRKK